MEDFVQEESYYSRRDVLKGGVATVGAAIIADACGTEKPTDPHENPIHPPTSEVITMPETNVDIDTSEFSSEPVWEQDFTNMPDGTPDKAFWRYELNPDVPGYNNEAQAYTDNPQNVRIEGGKLVIEAHREPYQYESDPEKRMFDYTSGRIDTLNSLNFEYGKLEVTMKLPEGSGTWPAIWLLSANQVFTDALHPTDSDWDQDRFYMHDGEVDIMEFYGKKPTEIEATLHTFNQSTEGHAPAPDDSGFHTYGIEITPERVTWTQDGNPFFSLDKPSDNPDDWPFGNGNKFYAILNLAMGSAGGQIDPNQNSWRIEVEDVKFYELAA